MKRGKERHNLFLWVVLIIIIILVFVSGRSDYKSGSVSGAGGILPIIYPYTNYYCYDTEDSMDSFNLGTVSVLACKELRAVVGPTLLFVGFYYYNLARPKKLRNNSMLIQR